MQWLVSAVLGAFTGPLLDGYKAKLAAGTSQATLAQGLALRELEVQAKEHEANTKLRIAQIGHWYEPEKLMCYITAAYYGQLVVIDKMIGMGSITEPLDGIAGVWAGMVMTYMFGKRTIKEAITLWKA